jgi:hypothetical protein
MGQIVGAAATGVTRSVVPSTNATGTPAGIALNSAAAGEYVAVAGNGSELMVMLSVVAAANDAGDYVGTSTVAGCALLLEGTVRAHDSEPAGYFPIGQCQEDGVAGSGTTGSTAYIIVNISPLWTAAS